MENKIILAPMAGVTDLAFRTICKDYGADIVYSEMVSAKAIHFGDKKTKFLINTTEYEQPLVVQLFGSNPEIMAESAKYLEDMGVTAIDINMGCPTPKIVSNGDGAALLKNPRLAGRIMCSVVNAIKIPVSIKIRSGWDCNSINATQIATLAQDSGIKSIAVHPRTKVQGYSGKADWEIIKSVKQTVKIPVVGNGDIFSADDAADILSLTGCDAIMIGRSALGNPFVFKQIKDKLSGNLISEITSTEKKSAIIKHLSLLMEIKGSRIGSLEARKHIAWYIKGMKNSSVFKSRAFSASSYNEFVEIIDELFN